MYFQSRTSSCWFNRGTTFHKRSQICSFRNITENQNLLVFNQARNLGDEAHTETFFARLEIFFLIV